MQRTKKKKMATLPKSILNIKRLYLCIKINLIINPKNLITMKKLLIAILFVLIVIPVNAQSVREEKEYHSRASVMGLSGREDPFYGAKAKLSYLSDGTISLKGCGIADGIYSPYHSISVYGVNWLYGYKPYVRGCHITFLRILFA